jgi:hypothetical protein
MLDVDGRCSRFESGESGGNLRPSNVQLRGADRESAKPNGTDNHASKRNPTATASGNNGEMSRILRDGVARCWIFKIFPNSLTKLSERVRLMTCRVLAVTTAALS